MDAGRNFVKIDDREIVTLPPMHFTNSTFYDFEFRHMGNIRVSNILLQERGSNSFGSSTSFGTVTHISFLLKNGRVNGGWY